MAKTMPMRVLEAKGISYEPCHQTRKLHIAEGVAGDVGVPVAQVISDELQPRLPHPTAMIVQRANNRPALVVIPVGQQLSLKKVSAALQDKGGHWPRCGTS